ncbi:cell surface protein SprA [Flavobacterium psychrophilum]|nr:cell surface protein SprA [Flavobacterium psychrophilum]
MRQFSLYKSNIAVKNSIFILLFFFSITVHAQVNPEPKDTVKGYNIGSLKLPNPNSILEAYTYDPITDRYIYTKTFEGFNINYPIVLTPKEYQELISREAMRDYFQKKSDAIDGKKQQVKILKRIYCHDII